MSVVKSFFIAFAMYSKIPMPQFEWKEKDMRYVISFFPLVGVVIGTATFFWWYLCEKFKVGTMAFAMIGAVIPLILTGGIHVDGFLDTMDAFHSYQSRERKLEILKDAHIGAFAVIQFAIFGLIYVGAYSQVDGSLAVISLAAGFYLSRILSGIGVVSFQCAKKDGLLYLFSSRAHEKIVKITLYLQLFLCMGFMLWMDLRLGGCLLVGAGLMFFYYWYRTKKELGGITGDTAGYFVTMCEGVQALLAAVYCVAVFAYRYG